MAKRKKPKTRTVTLRPGDVVIRAKDWKQFQKAARILRKLRRELKAQ